MGKPFRKFEIDPERKSRRRGMIGERGGRWMRVEKRGDGWEMNVRDAIELG
jgi:hypothetical protein